MKSKTYYRLYDNQTGCYMATGYNAESFKDLREQYISYKSVDLDEEEEDLNSLSDKDIEGRIKDDDFVIEISETPFREEEIPKPYAISVSDGHDEFWIYYDTEEQAREGFEQLKENESDIHLYMFNHNYGYEVIDSFWDEDEELE
jgi:hypothetical protein